VDGGNVLVLALLVNRTGEVLSARILVHSRFAAEDMTRFLAVPGAHIGPQPAIPERETRWLRMRFEYHTSADSELP